MQQQLQTIKEYFFNLFQLTQSKRDRAILIVCIFIALIFWIFVKLSKTYRSPKDVSVVYELPDNQAFQEMPPHTIRATIEGIGWELMREYFTRREPVIYFDLKESPLLYISNAQLRSKVASAIGNNNVEVVRMNYEDINLELEPKMSKLVPIRLQDSITFAAEHFLLDSIILEPDSVLVEGPESLLTNITSWQTNLLMLHRLKNTTKSEVSLQNPAQPQLSLNPKSIVVTVPVEQYTEKSLFVPIIVKNSPDSLKIFPSRIRLDVTVGLSQYNSIKEEDFRVEVDLKDASTDQNKNVVPIQIVEQPAAARSIQFSPKSVEFFILKG